jgi:hypothetical protein
LFLNDLFILKLTLSFVCSMPPWCPAVLAVDDPEATCSLVGLRLCALGSFRGLAGTTMAKDACPCFAGKLLDGSYALCFAHSSYGSGLACFICCTMLCAFVTMLAAFVGGRVGACIHVQSTHTL